MSEPPAELKALFANLMPIASSGRASGTLSPVSQQQVQQGRMQSTSPGLASHLHYAQPSVSSPLLSPPIAGTPPHHGSDIISPNVPTPKNESNSQTSANTATLLNLLKYNLPSSTGGPSKSVGITESSSSARPGVTTVGNNQAGHNRGISASDLVASFMPRAGMEPPVSAAHSVGQGGSTEREATSTQPGEDAQDLLLRLLRRPKPQSSLSSETLKQKENSPVVSPPAAVEPDLPEKVHVGDRKSSPVRTFGSRASRENTPFEPPKPHTPAQPSIFSYVNPFEQLAAVSPRPKSTQAVKPRSGQTTPAPSTTKAKEPERKASTGLTRPREEAESLSTSGQPGSQESPPGKKLKTKDNVSEEIAASSEKVEVHVEVEVTPEPSAKPAAETKQPSKDAAEGLERQSSAEKPVSNGKAVEDLAESWENETERIVPVYSFPLRPFVSITWKGNTTDPVSVRDDGFMDIARLKKPFDQLDRSLTSATADYIVYALSKGGIRIIRQDDGRDRQVFRSTNDRIFHVALCRAGPSPPEGAEQAVLGIGVSGSVYWASLSNGDDNLFEKDALETRSLIFPPFPASDENTSGGQLKTRARPSLRHPEFFAIGRGKSIHLVWPSAALSPSYGVSGSDRKVDTEKFYKERALKISTGKAGKDFIFSDDDTVIVSLDKTGRLRFWDIREALTANPNASKPDIRVPLLTLVTGAPNEKSWPTSVLFIDKIRPYLKVCAMRYMLVGFRQNHTLQLWDLGLGKAVQELNFPHDKESDAICSVAYHPGSGIIVVGHPTRNSIYFVHLSAPKYVLSPMTQAAYIQGVVDKDEKLYGPQSTACMSGIRELSFGSRGELRSLELLPLGKGVSQRNGEEDTGLFELYVMHSKGVTCLNIKKTDLGWSTENKIIQSVDGLEDGYIELKDLRTYSSQDSEGETPPSISGNNKEATKPPEAPAERPSDSQSPRDESPIKEEKKKVAETVPMPSQQEVTQPEKVEKKKKKKGAVENGIKPKRTAEAPKSVAQNGEIQSLQTSAGLVPIKQEIEQPLIEKSEVLAKKLPIESLSAEVLVNGIKRVEETVSATFSKSLSHELQTLYTRFDDDRRAQDELSVSRQDAVLRLVSSTLSENVEKNLARIINSNIESTVVPAIKVTTAASLEKKVAEELDKSLRAAIPQSVGKSFPDAVSRAMQAPGTLKAISELVAPAIVKSVESEFTSTVRNKILPSIKNDFTRTTEQLIKEAEQSFSSKLRQYEDQRISDGVKIDQLTTQVNSLVQIVSTMAASQAKFQAEILQMSDRFEEMQLAAQKQGSSVTVPVAEKPATPQLSPQQAEFEEIRQLLDNGLHEEASVKVNSSLRCS